MAQLNEPEDITDDLKINNDDKKEKEQKKESIKILILGIVHQHLFSDKKCIYPDRY